MKRKHLIYKWLIAIWLICAGPAVSHALAYSQAQQPSAWRTTPVLSTDRQPAYQFRSTSPFTPIVGQTSYTSTASYNPLEQSIPKNMRRGIDDEEDDPSGDPVGSIDTPIGDIPFVWMVIMACLFAGITKKRKNRLQLTDC